MISYHYPYKLHIFSLTFFLAILQQELSLLYKVHLSKIKYSFMFLFHIQERLHLLIFDIGYFYIFNESINLAHNKDKIN